MESTDSSLAKKNMIKFKDLNQLKKMGYFGIIFGEPGVGKTSLLSYRSKNFFIGNELNREFNTQGLTAVDNWNQFLNQLEYIKNNIESVTKKFDTLVLDNFTDIESMLISSFAQGKNLTTWNGGFGAGYAEAEKLCRKIIEGYLKPLQEKGLNIVFICHSKEKQYKDHITDNSYILYKPSLEDRTLKPLEAYATFIFNLHIPKISTSKEVRRTLYTGSNLSSLTKKKKYIDLPDIIEVKDPKATWDIIHSKLIFDVELPVKTKKKKGELQ